jgi:hypothetical protein
MNCEICEKVMKKDIKIEEVKTCYKCRMIWLKALIKCRKFALKHKEDLQY